MVRATRSSVAQQEKDAKEKDKPIRLSPQTTKSKHPVKKRKRASLGDHDGQPASKLHRADDDDVGIKEEEEDPSPDIPLTGDLPLAHEDAQRVLDVLEMVDTQGLLDRVFPLPPDVLETKLSSEPSSSKLSPDTYSLRTLLKESQDYPLRVLRTAVEHLLPMSSQPRSRASPPAAQQLRFCQLALSLLHQVSHNLSHAISLDHGIIIPQNKDSDHSIDHDADHQTTDRRRRYALMQKLPGATWWSSLNSDIASIDPEAKDLKDLGTAHAELVSVLPTPSRTSDPLPKLGDFFLGKKPLPIAKLPGPRYVSCGSFLDYGPFSSFAPSFDNDGCDIGRTGLGTIMWRRHEKMKAKEKARLYRQRLQAQSNIATIDAMELDGASTAEAESEGPVDRKERTRQMLHSLLDPADADSMDSVLENLELEDGVTELLELNARALARLEELQTHRLGGEKFRPVKEDSEEWETAQKIMNSLILLASLRPRSTTDQSPPLIPPKSVLRTLHETLPSEASQGWYGTLTESHGAAARDDMSLRVRSSAAAQGPGVVPATPAPAQTPAAAVTSTPTPVYAQQNYSYSNAYRAAYAYPAQAQTSSYYPNTYQQTAGTPQPQANTYAHSTQTQQYPYTGWYANYQPQSTNATGGTSTPGTTSGRGTPQPAVAPAVGYSGFFATSATAPPTRAVANTVTSSKPQTNGWATGAGGYTAPTLPPHLRPVMPATPGTPTPQAAGYATHYLAFQTPTR